MVDSDLRDLFRQNSVDKQLVIQTDDGKIKITNKELHSQQFELTESLCSESQLRFGCCEASSIKFRISNVFESLTGKWLEEYFFLDKNMDKPFRIGRHKVASDVPTADRSYRDVVAYDAIYDIINANVEDWYNMVLPNKDSIITMKDFRKSFLTHFGLLEKEITLANDDMIIQKTVEPSELSGKDVLNAICEINGCFAHIGRDGRLEYVYLQKDIKGLYPSNELFPSDNLFPKDANTEQIKKSHYLSCKYEDFVTKEITKLQIRQTEDDIGAIVGNGDNTYIVEDNFLVYGKNHEDLGMIARNLFEAISDISYRPFSAECIGDPCLEVGDAVRLSTKHQLIESYILKRTLKGIQSLRDTYTADGKVEYAEKVNSLNRSIVQLKGKTNELTRTVEENKSTIKDLEENVSSEIKQLTDSVAISIDKKGNVITNLTLDKNGISFAGNFIVIKANNFSIDEDGSVTMKGKAYIDNGLSVYIPEYIKPSGHKFEKGYYEVVVPSANSVKVGNVNTGDNSDTYMLFDREGFASLYANGSRVFHANEYGTYGFLFFDCPISAEEGIYGKIQCSDNTLRHSIGTSVNDSNYSIAYINSKARNSDGNYYITVNGLWENDTYSSHNIVSASSDARLKDNIDDCDVNALDLINKIKVRRFNWKSNGSEQKIGFVADELEELDPRLSVGGEKEPDGTINYKSVNGYYLQGYEIKAIQELSKQNQEMKSEIEELKKTISFLMERLGGKYE